VGHTSKSSSLLGVQASLARVSQSVLKTGGGATMGGARDTIAKVASEASCSWTGQCDGLRRTLLPLLCHFLLLGLRGVVVILAFCLGL
jgi:hypothetical protein